MKTIHYDIPKITRIDGATRLYETPNGKRYPSVTAVVGHESKIHIEKWKQNVGADVAANISRKAANRGTLIHENCENFLQGKPETFTMFQGEERKMYLQLLPVLQSIKEIHALETQLFSHRLEVAGTVDLIAKLDDGKIYIIDWKTSSRYKSRDDIHGYFCQCAAYSMMFFERTGVIVPEMRIVMVTEEFGLLDFLEPVKPWLGRFLELRERFRTETGL